MGTGGGYRVSHAGLSGQATELDGCGDDADRIRNAIRPTACYASDALGGSDSAPAFDRFAAGWEAEAHTLRDALHELADKVHLAKGSYHGSDHVVEKRTNGVHVPDGQRSTTSPQRPSALGTY